MTYVPDARFKNYEQRVKQDTPRLVVRYRLHEGRDEFEWGLVPSIPMLSLIGGISTSQIELHASTDFLDDANCCPELGFILAWDGEKKRFYWFVHHDVPIDPLIGMIETIKMQVVASMEARRLAAAQRVLLGPDGRPVVV